MTPGEVRAALNPGTVVKVFFDRHTETVVVVSIDSDGVLCRPVSAGSGGNSAEFWLAYSQISQVEKVDI
jgi:hypothetical protein